MCMHAIAPPAYLYVHKHVNLQAGGDCERGGDRLPRRRELWERHGGGLCPPHLYRKREVVSCAITADGTIE